MMLGRLTVWDMKFQIKYGFYLLYSVLTVIYLIILLAMPESWRTAAAAILIFSDPAAMGLFFMGAIVLLEKSQKVPCAYAVTPVRAIDYIGAKVISLCTISIAVAAILAVAVKAEDLPPYAAGNGIVRRGIYTARNYYCDQNFKLKPIYPVDGADRSGWVRACYITYVRSNACRTAVLSAQCLYGYDSRQKDYGDGVICCCIADCSIDCGCT